LRRQIHIASTQRENDGVQELHARDDAGIDIVRMNQIIFLTEELPPEQGNTDSILQKCPPTPDIENFGIEAHLLLYINHLFDEDSVRGVFFIGVRIGDN
jgi:hypothetical protein